MSLTLQDYLNLITSEHSEKPKFMATVSAVVSPLIQMQNVLQSMIDLFDPDLAVGDQLDIIGKWAGISRSVQIPITGVYFAFDGNYTVGWDYGSWQPSDQPVTITSLPDDAFRTLLRAKIAANHWDGTTEGAYDVFDAVFPDFKILIQDNYNMTYNLGVVGGIVDSLTLALLTGGYIPLRPQGVRVQSYYVSVDSNPAFSWDIESSVLGGWDEASWVREIAPS